jgi:hypothetical protein
MTGWELQILARCKEEPEIVLGCPTGAPIASVMGAMPRVHCTYSRRFAVARSRCNQGQEICVSVAHLREDGHGMAPEILDR